MMVEENNKNFFEAKCTKCDFVAKGFTQNHANSQLRQHNIRHQNEEDMKVDQEDFAFNEEDFG